LLGGWPLEGIVISGPHSKKISVAGVHYPLLRAKAIGRIKSKRELYCGGGLSSSKEKKEGKNESVLIVL
jgi:hypothetical protein